MFLTLLIDIATRNVQNYLVNWMLSSETLVTHYRLVQIGIS